MQRVPNKESLVLWELLTHNEVLLEVGGEHWRQSLEKGILQGTAYSAELFSRVIAWTLEPIINQTQRPVKVGGVSFPPMLLYMFPIEKKTLTQREEYHWDMLS